MQNTRLQIIIDLATLPVQFLSTTVSTPDHKEIWRDSRMGTTKIFHRSIDVNLFSPLLGHMTFRGWDGYVKYCGLAPQQLNISHRFTLCWKNYCSSNLSISGHSSTKNEAFSVNDYRRIQRKSSLGVWIHLERIMNTLKSLITVSREGLNPLKQNMNLSYQQITFI